MQSLRKDKRGAGVSHVIFCVIFGGAGRKKPKPERNAEAKKAGVPASITAFCSRKVCSGNFAVGVHGPTWS